MDEIYLDNAATTRCDPEVARTALELMTEEYGNPSSLHRKGIRAQMRLDAARDQLAWALGCTPEEITFTGSGTEANNLGVMGAAAALRRRGGGIVAMSSMHASALKPLEKLAEQGFSVRLVPPRADGNADIDALVEAVDDNTVLLVCEFVNSEVGTVTHLERLSRLVRRKKKDIHIHCDGVQALGKVYFSVKRLDIDSFAVSAHKIFAPKGCGALYLRRGARALPLLYGGGQERGLRSGTENTPAICAFGHAAQIVAQQYGERMERVTAVREYFVNKAKKLSGVCINSPADSTPYISNIAVTGIRSETMLHFMAERGIYLSSGSACSKGEASHVLTAMGLPRQRVDSALRISLSPHNTIREMDIFFNALEEGMKTLARSNG